MLASGVVNAYMHFARQVPSDISVSKYGAQQQIMTCAVL